MTNESRSQSLHGLVHDVVVIGGMLHQFLHHMEAFGAGGTAPPDSPPPDETLRDLITGILETKPQIAERPDLAAVTEVLSLITSAMEEDLFLVAPTPTRTNRAMRRRRGC